MTYSIIGDDLAQNRFSIDQSGIIRTTTGIQGDNSDYYIVSIIATTIFDIHLSIIGLKKTV